MATPLPASELPKGISVEVKQYRADYGPRILQISVTNDSPEAATVTSASFTSASFDRDAGWSKRTNIPAGSTRDLRVTLAAPVCSVPTDTGRVELAIETTDGASTRSTVSTTVPADPLGTVAGIVAQDCFEVRIQEQATLVLNDDLTIEERSGVSVAILTLVATPAPQEPPAESPPADATGSVTSAFVSEASRTILLRPADGNPAWYLNWMLSPSAPPQSATLPFIPNNCNPHVVAEDKRGTFIPLQTTLSDGTTGTYYVASSTALRSRIYAYIAQYCGW